MSDANIRWSKPPTASLADAFRAAPMPLALLDGALQVVSANTAFTDLLGLAPEGRPLTSVLPPLQGTPLPPAGDGSVSYKARGRSGPVQVRITRSGETLVASAVPPAPRSAGDEALIALGREVASARSEEALVATLARTLRTLFPGRRACIRIVDPKTFALTALQADGRLRPGAADVLVMRRSSADRLGLGPESLAPDRVRLTDRDEPVFEGSRAAIAVPLVASGQLFGLLNVEHDGGVVDDPEADDRTLIQVANTASVGVRNAKLIDELTFVRKYLEDLIQNANALILVTNRDRRMIVFNRAMSELSGFGPEEVIGADFLDFVPESERKRLTRVIAQSLRGQPVSNFETRLLHRSGEEKRVAFSTAAILSPEDEVEGVIAIGQDLTSLKELERRVIQAEKLASLGQLAASVVHEINNPLTGILVSAESFKSRFALDPSARGDLGHVQRILENGNRILRFTRDLVSYARPSSDRIEPIDLHQVLDQAVGFCDHVLGHSGVKVVRDYGALPPVRGMRNNLAQVFVNLITNACHAMKPGGTITLVSRASEGAVELEVRDDGSGIEPRHLAKIFEPFFSTKADGKGTGLGLSIVQGIIEKHGGAISAESVLGRGTTFRIRLPEQGPADA